MVHSQKTNQYSAIYIRDNEDVVNELCKDLQIVCETAHKA